MIVKPCAILCLGTFFIIQNHAQLPFSNQNIIYQTALDAKCVHAADLDGDGDMDALPAEANPDGRRDLRRRGKVRSGNPCKVGC